MKALTASMTKSLPTEAEVVVCDNSGAKIIKLFTIMGAKTVKGKKASGCISDLVMGSVKSGRPDMRKTVVYAVIVRQKKEFRRLDGTRVKFEDNAAVVLKDDKGNPKGTMIKGPIAKEVCDRWPAIAKIASIIV